METMYKCLILSCCISFVFSYEEDRNERTFSLFNVVKFKNTGCQSTSNADLQGVCYTKEECSQKAGTADGNCAASFGVCCIISISGTDADCTGTITQNCSYIENPTFPTARNTAGTCTYMINRCSSDICQIRLDFKVGTLMQPSSVAATRGQCSDPVSDSLTLTPGSGNVADNNIPVLCGTLTGQHVYLEASRTLDLAATVAIATLANGNQSWRIKVSQIECHNRNKAPQGCLQYFTGSHNTITSFNFDGTNGYATGGQIANQDYRTCFRQESGMCGLQYTESTLANGANAFELDGAINAATTAGANHANCAINGGAACLNAAANTCSFIQIPGGSQDPINANSMGDIFCGQFLNPMGTADVAASVRTTVKPFTLRHAQLGNTMNAALAGYSLDVTQIPC